MLRCNVLERHVLFAARCNMWRCVVFVAQIAGEPSRESVLAVRRRQLLLFSVITAGFSGRRHRKDNGHCVGNDCLSMR